MNKLFLKKETLRIIMLLMVSALTLTSASKTYSFTPSTIKAGLPITIGTTNYLTYSFVDPSAFFGAGLSYNLFFGGSLSLGITGAMAFNPSFPNPSYIGGGLSLNYVISGGSAIEIEGDFLTLKSYPDFTTYVGLGFAAKQFDFLSQVEITRDTTGKSFVGERPDVPQGVFYGLMLNAGLDWALYDNIILGGEFHYIFSLGAQPTDPIANIIEIIIGAGFIL